MLKIVLVQHISRFSRDDINKTNVRSQLQVLHLYFSDKTVPSNIFAIKDYMKSFFPAKKLLLSEICSAKTCSGYASD